MPSAPPQVCSKAGCYRVAESGRRCSLHPPPIKPERARTAGDKRYDEKRGTAHQRGYDKRLWGRARARQLAEEPLCRHCKQVGRVTAATEVDHITPLLQGGTHEPENLQSLCHPCHVRKTYVDGSVS